MEWATWEVAGGKIGTWPTSLALYSGGGEMWPTSIRRNGRAWQLGSRLGEHKIISKVARVSHFSHSFMTWGVTHILGLFMVEGWTCGPFNIEGPGSSGHVLTNTKSLARLPGWVTSVTVLYPLLSTKRRNSSFPCDVWWNSTVITWITDVQLVSCFILKLKADRPHPLSAYAHWLQTHRQRC